MEFIEIFYTIFFTLSIIIIIAYLINKNSRKVIKIS